MHRVLAVHPDADVLDLMAGALDEKYPDLILVPVRNAAMPPINAAHRTSWKNLPADCGVL